MRIFLLTAIIAPILLWSCSDSDNSDNNHVICPGASDQWSATLKGNGEVLGAYPDLYSNYWEYTYNVAENPNVALCFEGQFPYARYFSFSLYNDETGSAIGGMNDVEIKPDDGSENPFCVTSNKINKFTIYLIPPAMTEEQVKKLPSKNICRIDSGVNKLAVCIRHYLGQDSKGNSDEYGGVVFPLIRAIDIRTLKEVAVPQRITSNVYKVTGKVFTQVSDYKQDVPFFLAPSSRYYPNNSTSYLYARTHLTEDSVLTFSFIPVPIPQRPEGYPTAAARYWSICLGSASNTRSYYSIFDKAANTAENEKTSFAVCLKQNPKLNDIQTKIEKLNKAGKHWNLFVWDKDKLDVDGKPIGSVIVIMYRNILANKNWPHSIANMLPTDYKNETGEPIDHVTDPSKQIAHKALGDYGPHGMKHAVSDFLNANE